MSFSPSLLHAQEESFKFAVIGDVPYTRFDEHVLLQVLEHMGQIPQLALVIHDGNFKAAHEPCTDDLLQTRKSLLDAAIQPLVLIPGDNEWVDCQQKEAGGFTPSERLNRLRELFFDDEFSLGQQKIRLSRQSEMARFRAYRENVRWEYGSGKGRVLFVALNLTGDNNNFSPQAGRNAEFEERREANRQWLSRAFTHAKQEKMAGIVIIVHGNPIFENKWRNSSRPSFLDGLLGSQPYDGYRTFKQQLQTLVAEYPGQILLIHGDSQNPLQDHPLQDANGKPLTRLTRISSYGYPYSNNWIQVTIDPSHPAFFQIRPRYVPPPTTRTLIPNTPASSASEPTTE